MPKKRFSAEQIVVVLRQIEVLMSQGKAAPVARQPVGERLLRILQRQAARRVPQWRDLLQPEGSQGCDPAMAQALQHDQTALIPELSTASTADVGPRSDPSGSDHSNAIVSIPLVQNIRQVSINLANIQFHEDGRFERQSF